MDAGAGALLIGRLPAGDVSEGVGELGHRLGRMEAPLIQTDEHARAHGSAAHHLVEVIRGDWADHLPVAGADVKRRSPKCLFFSPAIALVRVRLDLGKNRRRYWEGGWTIPHSWLDRGAPRALGVLDFKGGGVTDPPGTIRPRLPVALARGLIPGIVRDLLWPIWMSVLTLVHIPFAVGRIAIGPGRPRRLVGSLAPPTDGLALAFDVLCRDA